jgi:hypothetical protein
VYADLLEGADGGEYFMLTLPQNGATYASGDSPSDAGVGFTDGDTAVEVRRELTPTIETDSLLAGADAMYTVSYTTSVGLVADDLMATVFPDEYDVGDVGVACTDDGDAISGDLLLFGQTVVLQLTEVVESGSDVVCEYHVVNPGAAGSYDGFAVGSRRLSDIGLIEAESTGGTPDTFAIVQAASQGRRALPDQTATVTINTPSEGAELSGPVVITWSYAGDVTSFANIVYYQDNHRYIVALGTPNSGSYTWTPPISLQGSDIELSVEVMNPSAVVFSDRVQITVGDSVTSPETTDEYAACDSDDLVAPDLSTRLYKSRLFPTVYYLDTGSHLRPFFNASIFFSWNLAFKDIRTVEHDWLSNYTLGAPMVPLPGSTLIKSPDDPRVWVMEPNDANPALPVLHWIGSEAVARAYFGNNWATRIIDVAPSVTVMSPKGDDLTDPANPPCYIQLYN